MTGVQTCALPIVAMLRVALITVVFSVGLLLVLLTIPIVGQLRAAGI